MAKSIGCVHTDTTGNRLVSLMNVCDMLQLLVQGVTWQSASQFTLGG